MTKLELATRLAEKANLSKADAIRAVKGFMEAMADAFAEKESIYMRGFGTFKIVVRAEKKARNIRKGTEVMIPQHLSVKFIPCDSLLNKMNPKGWKTR